MKAVLKNGLIHPQEPVPEDWSEGTEVEVEKLYSPTAGDALDEWFAELEAGCSQMDPEDEKRLHDAINEIRAQEKELERRKAALEA